DARHQALPRRRPFAFGDVPADHVPVGDGDQHHGVAVQVNAVHMHHVMHLVHQGHRRPQAPHQLAPAAQRAGGQVVLGLRPFGKQPVQSAPQVTGPVVARLGARAPAAGVPAPPPDPPRACSSVPFHRLAAHGATGCVHPPNLPRQLESRSTVVPKGLTACSGHTFWPTSSSPPIQLEQGKRPLPQRKASQNRHTFWPITLVLGFTRAKTAVFVCLFVYGSVAVFAR
ncbi:hypothetical protein BHAP_1610, partial [Bifidobacterium hapali]